MSEGWYGKSGAEKGELAWTGERSKQNKAKRSRNKTKRNTGELEIEVRGVSNVKEWIRVQRRRKKQITEKS